MASSTNTTAQHDLHECGFRRVGRGESSPLSPDDLTALAKFLRSRDLARGELLFQGGSAPVGVWIVRQGRAELSVGSGRLRSVVHVLQPGDIDGMSSTCWTCRCPNRPHARRGHGAVPIRRGL
ncbi:cyclic nucleotide-binding domain-containing protein [Saccharopolyspora shandongensis]|uniref:cyclic nucleotide-binding domain-containing protein n=1 Tax=Saccharopolyspora shandongensis TaxID=418495 RepID=UPI0033EDF0A0